MADITKIGWTRSTFNPWIGCTKVGPGCDNCYAEAQDVRKLWGNATHWGPGVPRFITSQAYWRRPFLWNEEAARTGERWLVFSASLADIFDNEVPPAWREAFFRLVKATPHLTWQIVTKRIGNAAKMLPADWGDGYPNVWLISTVVTQAEADRDIPKLVSIPARVHGLSIEPQVEAIDLMWPETLFPGGPSTCCDGRECGCRGQPVDPWLAYGIDWVICGGESEQRGECRLFDMAWARSLRAQCAQMGIPFFMKQLGSAAHDFSCDDLQYTGKGDDPNEWPEEIRVREFPQ